jgi:hypothetical protein
MEDAHMLGELAAGSIGVDDVLLLQRHALPRGTRPKRFFSG